MKLYFNVRHNDRLPSLHSFRLYYRCVLDSNTTFASSVAATVRAFAAARGLNQTDLSRSVGISQQSLSAKWRGKSLWNLNDLEAVAGLFGVEPWKLTQPREDLLPSNAAPAVGEKLAPARQRDAVRAGQAVPRTGLEPVTHRL